MLSGIGPAAHLRAMGIAPVVDLHPDSRGEIPLRSTDPREPPRIAYNFFSAPDGPPMHFTASR